MSKSKSKSGTFAGLVLFPVCLLGFFILHSAFFISPAQTPGPNNGAYLAANRTAAPGVGGFDPSTVTGYALDYDVNALALTDGTAITTLDDKSANKFHLLNYGGSYWTNNSGQLNNLGFAFFDGTDDYFQTNFTAEYAQNTTIFVVARFRTQNRSVPFLFDGGGAGGLTRQAVYNDGSWKAWAGQPLAFSPAPTADTWQLFEIHFQGTTTSYIAINGSNQTAGNAGTQSQKGFSLGIKYDDDEANTAWTGDIARVLFFSADVTGADLTYIRDGLIALYGL